jgi:hypothetical protein
MLLNDVENEVLPWPDLAEKAARLGIHPEGTERGEVIRAIQRAEGNNPCFGASKGHCVHGGCCFRAECLGTGGQSVFVPARRELKLSQKVPLALKTEEEWMVQEGTCCAAAVQRFSDGDEHSPYRL